MVAQANGQNPSAAALLTRENIVDIARRNTTWTAAVPGQGLAIQDRVRTGELSRATVRLTDLSVLRMNELTTIEILAPEQLGRSEGVNVKNGAMYFFSREKPRELRITTPVATGALRGTEFHVAVAANGRTTVTMIDGEVELSNAQGRILIRNGEQGEVVRGQAPKKTAVIETINIIQWCLYYPGVIDIDELKLPAETQRRLTASLEAYRQGDVLGALRMYPMNRAAESEAEQIYRAAVLLTVGQVDKANAALRKTTAASSTKRALETLIAAVKYQPPDASVRSGSATESRGGHDEEAETRTSTGASDSNGKNIAGANINIGERLRAPNELGNSASASEWLARSYYEQARANLENALAAAKQATTLAPSFGFAWTRVAELEFSFGRAHQAEGALQKGTSLAPLNAGAFSLRGFVLSAQNSIGRATESFEHAMELDGALGDAWLGRGLCRIRRGRDVEGREDIQTAVVLEPNRSLFRSYLGKAFSNAGADREARQELQRAIQIDPNDPTPWLYSALQARQEHKLNEAVRNLEQSIELNNNRRLFRSEFLLDQDRAVRSTNLASIYQDNGMTELSVREATRAVEYDYADASAHRFLADSYNDLRDPRRITLRYETPWQNELLLYNMIAPVGGGSLSAFVSQQEYSKLFEADRLGLTSTTNYYSTGEFREVGSQYGIYGNVSYDFDTEYLYQRSLRRPNSQTDNLELTGRVKLQLTPEDTIYLEVQVINLRTGDVSQRFDQQAIFPNLHYQETQEPGILIAGYHHEWNPGIHSLFLITRLGDSNELSNRQINPFIVERGQDGNVIFASRNVIGTSLNLHYESSFEIYGGEFNQIFETTANTLIVGTRIQEGAFQTLALFQQKPLNTDLFGNPAASQSFDVNFQRATGYLYDIFRPSRQLSVTLGAAYDSIQYPENFRDAPILGTQSSAHRFSPKAGVTWNPFGQLVVRGAYTRALGGASFDESVLLEPTQVAGFTQVYRSIIPESIAGPVAAPRFEFYGLSLENKFTTGTYVGIQGAVLKSRVDREIGIFEATALTPGSIPISPFRPASTAEKISYDEQSLLVTFNQLIGEEYSLGTTYRLSSVKLKSEFPDIPISAYPPPSLDDPIEQIAAANPNRRAALHQLDLFGLFNHRSGFFARADALWYHQENDRITLNFVERFDGKTMRFEQSGVGDDDFWQFNVSVGYRFHRNLAEISLGILNLTDTNYTLNPLNLYQELPRERTLLVRAKLNF